ncbi:ATP-binding protein [Streptomyces sp. NPDC085932]|uniref:ATP-binding protein n=1 Tax=Streptomyces sp. NPDC085932 TaxID=3365741 RepID=UPI0037D67F20
MSEPKGSSLSPAATSDFVGRDAQLRSMTQLAETVRAGQSSLILVEGPSGIGKTALVRRWLEEPALSAATILRARCDPAESDLSFGVIAQLIADVPADQRSESLRTTCDIAPGTAPFRVGAQLLELLDALQSLGLVVVFVDDIQWADTASLQVLGFVIRRLEADRVLPVMTARTSAMQGLPEPVRRLIDGHDRGLHVALEGLKEQEVAQLAKRNLGHDIPRTDVGKLRRHTGGNPLYLRAVLAELADQESAQIKGSVPVPPTLASRVRQQLSQLPERSRILVQASAILGGRFPLSTVARTAEVVNAHEALEPALTEGLLNWWPNEHGIPVSVSHQLLSDAVLAATPPERLRRLHTTAAACLPRSAAWSHRVAAATDPDDRLAAQLEMAAGEHLTSGEVGRASTLLLWAAEVSSAREESERYFLTALAQLLWDDQVSRADELMRQARACAQSSLRSLVLGAHATSRGTFAEAEDHLNLALEAAQNNFDESWITTMAATWLSFVHLFQGHGRRTIAAANRALEMEPVNQRLTSRAMVNLAFAHGLLNGPHAAVEELNRLAPLPDAEHMSAPQAYFLLNRGGLRSFAGQLSAGALDTKVALRLAASSGRRVTDEFGYSTLAADLYLLGSWDEATANAERAVASATTEERVWAYPIVYSQASWVYAGRGQYERAERLLDTAEAWAEEAAQAYRLYPAIGRAVVAQARADYAAMVSALQPLLQLPAEGGRLLFQPWWLPLYVEGLLGTNALERAEEGLHELRRLTDLTPHLGTVTARLSAWFAEQKGDDSRSMELFEQGVSLPASADDVPLYRAMLDQAYGVKLIACQQVRDGVRWLRQAHERLSDLQAIPFLERCEAALDAIETGAPKRRRRYNLYNLSDRELDIAQSVSRGLTNREIASELFISTKTVEYHLGNIYTRLGLTSRRELRDLIQRPQPPVP